MTDPGGSEPVVIETRYGGIYEGGAWAAFDVPSEDTLPPEAFGGDTVAADWWWGGPSVLVAAGDDPESARNRLLEFVEARRSGRGHLPPIASDSKVRVAACAPDGWHRSEVGVVESSQPVEPTGRYANPDVPAWEYAIRFDDGSIETIPEQYLRLRRDPAEEPDLIRYWFTFDVADLGPNPGPPGTVTIDGGTLAYRLCGGGIGVTGYDEVDCLTIIEEVLDGEPVPLVSSRVRDVDVQALHLRAPVGVPSWRGIWYPALNLKGPFYFQTPSGLNVQPLTVPHSVMQWPSNQNGWVADINGDGWPDILSAEYYGPLSVSLNTTGGMASGIVGTVHNSSSAPLANFKVDAFDGNNALVASTTTDGSGHYYLSYKVLNPTAVYSLRFTDPASNYPTAWYSTSGAKGGIFLATPVSYNLGSTTTADLTIPNATSVTGKVQNGHHNGVGGLTVSLYAPGGNVSLGSATTAGDGTFTVEKLLPGGYMASIADPGGNYETEWWGVPGRLKTGSSGPTLTVTGPSATQIGTHIVGATGCSTNTFAHGAALSGKTLTGCWLKGVDVSAAALNGTDLAGSQLIMANLASANLPSADLTHASLLLADLSASTRTSLVYGDTTCPDGTNSDRHNNTCDGHTGNPVGGNAPIGELKDVTSGPSTNARGWAIDPNTVDPISVKVTVDGLSPVVALANLANPDAASAQPLYGADHGFDVALGSLPPGVHEVCVTALNIGPGADVTLGCRVIDNPETNTRFNAVQPARLLDTRDGTGTGGSTAPLGSGASLDLKVTGHAGVPDSHVGAVVLNITATQPSESSFLTVWPTLTSRPLASNLNFPPGQTAPNLVVAKVGANGKVSIFNNVGTTHVLADVTGWFDDGTVGGGRYHPSSPIRVLDTRDGTGLGAPQAVGPGKSVHLQLGGNNGVPLNGTAAVVLNVTATQPTAPSHLTVFPTGTVPPLASNLNFIAGQTVPNLVIAKVSADGWVDIFNNAGTVQVIADLEGWFDTGTFGGAAYNPLPPARVLDTRDGTGSAPQPVGPATTIHVRIAQRGGVPTGVQAVVLNVTVTNPTAPSFLTVYPTGSPKPLASNLNFVAGQTVPNLVIAKVSADGFVDIFNNSGSTDVVADVAGWFA